MKCITSIIFFVVAALPALYGFVIHIPGFEPVTDTVTVANFEKKTYVYFGANLRLSWAQAHKYCIFRGMELVDIPTKAHYDWILNFISSDLLAITHEHKHHIIWTGISDIGNPGNFAHITTGRTHNITDFFYSKYKSDIVNSDSSNCVEIVFFGNPKQFLMNDFGCQYKLAFVCTFEKEKPMGKECLRRNPLDILAERGVCRKLENECQDAGSNSWCA